MLKIRLARHGAKKRPHYSIVVADVRSPRDGNFLEKIGRYNPMLARERDDRVVIDAERAKHWLAAGAQPTDRVTRFLSDAGLVSAPAQGENTIKAKPKKKAQERIAADQAKKAALEEAKKAAETAESSE